MRNVKVSKLGFKIREKCKEWLMLTDVKMDATVRQEAALWVDHQATSLFSVVIIYTLQPFT